MMKLFVSVLAVLAGFFKSATPLPSSECYALDRENFLYDFTDKAGRELELEGVLSDFVLRFCIDAQNRSQKGYVSYGRFLPQSRFMNHSSNIDFLQEYGFGDLMLCEHNGKELTGRKAEVEIICGSCPSAAPCKDEFGCICNVSYHHGSCKAKVLVALSCGSRGPRIPPGLSIGFQPRGSEVVKQGIPQPQFRKPFHNLSFGTNHEGVSLYMTRNAELDIGEVMVQVQPSQGLLVEITRDSGPSFNGIMGTSTLLQVTWTCGLQRDQPYEVRIMVPIKGYSPVELFLCKACEKQESSNKLYGAFGLSFFILLAIVAIFGILFLTYKIKSHDKALENLPLVPLLSENLDEVNDVEGSCQTVCMTENSV